MTTSFYCSEAYSFQPIRAQDTPSHSPRYPSELASPTGLMERSMTQKQRITFLALIMTCGLATISPAWAGKGGRKGGGKGDDTTAGPSYALEILDFDGVIQDFNDVGDVLGEVESVANGQWVYSYYFGTFSSGERVFDTVRLPLGWTGLELEAMNNSRQLVGRATYDPDGDGWDADRDGVLDEGDIFAAGVCLTPDTDADGRWELEVIFAGPTKGHCLQINNDGDILGQDDSFEGSALLRVEGTMETFPLFPYGIGLNNTFSDRDANGDVTVINSNYYLPRKYDTGTGVVETLPSFGNSEYAEVFAVNSVGEVVGRADGLPAYWSPAGEISRIPGWPKRKNSTGAAYAINELGEIAINSGPEGPQLFSPADGLISLTNALTNPEVIPEGYLLSRLFYINNESQIACTLNSDIDAPIPCVLYRVPQP